MRSAKEGENFQEFDLSGEIIESIRLTVNGRQLEKNDRALAELLKQLHAPEIDSGESPKAHTQVFANVPAKTIIDFLTEYKAGYGDKFGFTVFTYPNRDIEWDSSLVERYAKTQMDENPSITWNVAFINGEGGKVEGPDDLDFGWRKIIRKSSYNSDKGYFQITTRGCDSVRRRTCSKSRDLYMTGQSMPSPSRNAITISQSISATIQVFCSTVSRLIAPKAGIRILPPRMALDFWRKADCPRR